MIDLAIMARSSLDADQPHVQQGLGYQPLDLTMVARFKIRPSCYSYVKGLPMNQNFNVQGMTCGHCERAVTQAVKTIDPKAEVHIDRASGQVDVVSGKPREAILAAITDEGYATT